MLFLDSQPVILSGWFLREKHTPQEVHLQPVPQLQLPGPEQVQGPIVVDDKRG
jgi:hypothetical protein